jgi:ATP-binding cassette subfamily A (ABC1) protein 3
MDERYYEEHSPWIMQHEQNKNYLEMTNVMKQYPNGFKAVNGLNLKMYADQIFVLLGHNGAGKSSTISVLTGLYEPTEGEAEVFGIDMFKEFRKVREILGICPQFDIIFDLLTPEEHLDIFYDFKGGDMDPYKKKNEIDTLLEDVGLEEKRNFQTAKLSGGNQRKLSVAMALCGGSKLIILDEPTSTLDLSARRLLWNMLKEYRKDRIILLTTHYMDEADILGDRIGIMVKGKVTCLGSSLFLKKKFGCGYNLTMLKASTEMNSKVLKYAKERLGENCKLKSQN